MIWACRIEGKAVQDSWFQAIGLGIVLKEVAYQMDNPTLDPETRTPKLYVNFPNPTNSQTFSVTLKDP